MNPCPCHLILWKGAFLALVCTGSWKKRQIQGFNSPFKIKFQELFAFLHESHFGKNSFNYMEVIKSIPLQAMTTKMLFWLLLTVNAWNIIWDEFLQGFNSPDKSKLQEYSRSFPELMYLFIRVDLIDANRKNFSIPGYMRACINTCNMAENLAQQNGEWGNANMTILGTSLSAISSDHVWQILNSQDTFIKPLGDSRIEYILRC